MYRRTSHMSVLLGAVAAIGAAFLIRDPIPAAVYKPVHSRGWQPSYGYGVWKDWTHGRRALAGKKHGKRARTRQRGCVARRAR